MKVKDLIANSVWTPGKYYGDGSIPKISVLLPTFRRGKSGLFRRVVNSLLNQTLPEIEIIVIDDTSTDGTADQIAEFQDLDGRVSCIRHTANIGLPAVSEFEGYLKARAPLIAFAFDDTMFNEDALEKLYEESLLAPYAVIWGHIEWSYKEISSGTFHRTRFGSERSQGLLRLSNHIPNNAVLMPKHIVEDVGLYDPHIGMARVCDWDLWCRVAERYELKFVDVFVGLEDGPITGDSLGNTYSLDSAAVDEWMRQARNVKLRPENFGEYDVFAVDPLLGQSTITVLENLARKHAATRPWMGLSTPVVTADSDGYVLIIGADYGASTTLCFDMLPPSIAKRVRVITLHGIFSYEDMARATCVVFVRRIAALSMWLEAARAMGIPTYYFLDDNLPLLQSTREVSIPDEDYSFNKFRNNLKLFDGVLLSSQKLIAYFEERLFHDRLHYFPVSFYDQTPLSLDYVEEKLPSEICIVFTGGMHRSKGMTEIVFPAISKLAEDGQLIHLVLPGASDKPAEGFENLPTGLRMTFLPYDVGYLFAMRKFARFKPDFMVHAPSETANNSFKTLNPLVATTLLDCILIAPAHEPYTYDGAKGAIVLVTDFEKPVQWYKTLRALIDGEIDQETVKTRNREFCRMEYSGASNERTVREILRLHGGEVSWPEQARRLYKLQGWSRTKTGITTEQSAVVHAESITNELSAYRKMVRYSWRHRLLRRRTDLWDSVTDEFEELKSFSQDRGWRRPLSSLELSDSLHDIPYREYRVNPPEGKIKSILLAVSVDLTKLGLVGIEIVSPSNDIVDQVALNLQLINLNEPVRFDISGVTIKRGETWSIRVFAKSKAPVYVYEFINRKLLGIRFKDPTPFMAIETE